MARKQQPNLSGLDDPNWLPLGPDLHVAQDLAGKGLRIAYRERGDPNCNLALLDPGRPPDQQSNFFYYSWGPDHSKLVPWKEEEERLRSKLSQQKEERFTPPAPRKRGRGRESCRSTTRSSVPRPTETSGRRGSPRERRSLPSPQRKRRRSRCAAPSPSALLASRSSVR